MRRFITERLTPDHKAKHFSCGEHALDRYLKRYALRNQEDGFGVTYVLLAKTSGDDPGVILKEIIGYYTIAASNVDLTCVPTTHIKADSPKYPWPTLLLAKLAVEKTLQKKGFGVKLLLDAMMRADDIARDAGSVALEVHASNARARDFYLHYGFHEYTDDKNHLFLTISEIRKEISSFPDLCG